MAGSKARRIGLSTWGSEGDVRPFFALAEGLARAGHEVHVDYSSIDDRDYAKTLRGASFGFARVGSPPKTGEALRRAVAEVFADTNPARQLERILAELLEPMLPELDRAASELARRSELIVHHMLTFCPALAAEAAGVPTVLLHTAPTEPTRSFPPPGVPDLGPLNRAVWQLGLRMVERALTPTVRSLRAARGLPAVRSAREIYGRAKLQLLSISPSLLPRPPDWPAGLELTGHLELPRSGPAELPAAVEAFLSAGPPPVFVTFGSMTAVDPEPARVVEIVSAAIREVGGRAIVQAPAPAESDPNLLFVGPTPHELVFPRCAAIVHHGGAGTTQAAARSGRPSVVVAHITDQFFWARCLERHGVAPRHLTRRRLAPGPLAKAIAAAISTPQLAERAAALGERMRAEDGVARAVELISTSALG